MLISANKKNLQDVQYAIQDLKAEDPAQFVQFKNVISLTRQLQYSFQYLGCLIMDEDASEFSPEVQNSYVLSIYQQEIDKLKKEYCLDKVQQLLATYQEVSYHHICKLILGKEMEMLIGPMVVR
ncbi:hypothetical protein SAMN04487943_10297 [Gracilibacillus orientalis]|uniref:Uncharacterized protein n=1 Tax=Gracilibacillus orientalis TaxID=334253 RepID=A0A1I4IH51_9BACI|nr:hypothetical protein [Gracilibacillus orientalis]SFL53333.1 hypothetical protein SAMN04487943_10297 [Gracilibacillus orientalis]